MDALDSLVNFACFLSSSNLPTESNDNANKTHQGQKIRRTTLATATATSKYFPELAMGHLHSSANIQRTTRLYAPDYHSDREMQRSSETRHSYSIDGNRVQGYVNRGPESTSCGQGALNGPGTQPRISCPCDATIWTDHETLLQRQYCEHPNGAGETTSCTHPSSWPYQWLCNDEKCTCHLYAPALCSAFNNTPVGSLNGVRFIKPYDQWM